MSEGLRDPRILEELKKGKLVVIRGNNAIRLKIEPQDKIVVLVKK